MIVIYTDRDLGALSGLDFDSVQLWSVDEALRGPEHIAEDVYFWRNGNVKPLKRRNAPLVIPEWLEDRKEVDR